MKIAVIGSGVSGLSSAYYLSKKHKVDLFEKQDRFGGHSYTLDIKFNDNEKVAVDIGFMVFNKVTYPNLINFFKVLQNLSISCKPSLSVGSIIIVPATGHDIVGA